jgi:PhzF family phenazine biosynthesis protein
MTQTIIQVDAFTTEPFTGNPAAVCVLPEPAAEGWMQQVAREMNLSETAFLDPAEDGFNLRWFTPAAEVDLCGHATLAAAHVLWEIGHLPLDTPARFFTKSGLLTARRQADWIELDFPAEPEAAVEPPPALLEALGVRPTYVGKNRMDYLVEIDSQETLVDLQPNLNLLTAFPHRGTIVTSRADSAQYDFVSRFFAPQLGIDEDPVTGSAHCCLGPFWSKRLGKDELVAYQASARGGVVRVRVRGDRVILGGQAVTVLRGELL